jgi:DDE superfamily endonuclease
MFEYDRLRACPSAFRSLTGMSAPEFDRLLPEFLAAQERLRRSSDLNGEGRPRRRACGAGRHPKLDGRHRLLMALVWLRIYPTYELLGFFFGLHKRNAQLHVRATLEALDSTPDFPFDRPGAERRALSTPEQVMASFPAVRLVIDAREQRVNRPGASHEAQKPYYSGKKKCHTLKTQLAVGPDGLIESIGGSHPGGATHDLTLLRGSGLLDELGEGEAAMMDKGYVGIGNTHPGVPIVIPYKAARGRPLTAEQEGANREIARHRIVVEHAIAQMNRFTALRQVFRGWECNHEVHHSRAVRVVARLVNRRTRQRPLKVYKKAA